MSLFGSWITRDDLPAFEYRADQDSVPEAEWDPIQSPPTRRHWILIGNRALRAQVANDATTALFDERNCGRWLTAPDPQGTGVSIIECEGRSWGSAWNDRPRGEPDASSTRERGPGSQSATPVRTFGPTWFEVVVDDGDLKLERLLLCPEGELPWVLVRVAVTNLSDRDLDVRHTEQWVLGPRFVNIGGNTETRREDAKRGVRFEVEKTARGLRAVEHRMDIESSLPFPPISGPTVDFVLEMLGGRQGDGTNSLEPRTDGADHPRLELVSDLRIKKGEQAELWFRAGQSWGTQVLAMQANPLNNSHSHSQPLLSYLRLLGVEPTPDGRLSVEASGAAWSSPSFELDPDGHGRVEAIGEVTIETPFGTIDGGPGTVKW